MKIAKTTARHSLIFSFLLILLTAFASPLITADPQIDLSYIAKEFNAQKEQIQLSPELKIPVVINGADKSVSPVPWGVVSLLQTTEPKEMPAANVTVVGGGVAGVSLALKALLSGFSVVILEKTSRLGGLSSGHMRGGVQYDNGTAYFASLIQAQKEIFHLIGLDNYVENAAIVSPSDSLYIAEGIRLPNGKLKHLFINFWEDEKVLEELPASFALAKWAHYHLFGKGLIPDQPLEDAVTDFDKLSYTQLTNTFYALLKSHLQQNPQDVAAKKLANRIEQDIKTGRLNPQIKVDARLPRNQWHRGLMDAYLRYYIDNYGHSALGGYPESFNALIGLNFIFSEMQTRYTYPFGTEEIINRILKLFEIINRSHAKPLLRIVTDANVETIAEKGYEVETVFNKNGQRYKIKSDKLGLAIPPALAPRLIKDFASLAPQHNQILQKQLAKQQLTDYVVTTIFIKGHPQAVKLTYDLWIGYHSYSPQFPTDFISQEWAKTRGFQNPIAKNDRRTALTIYHAQGPSHPLNSAQLLVMAENDIKILKQIYRHIYRTLNESNPLLQPEELSVEFAEINLWKNSILVSAPGHLADVRILKQPIGKNILFASSELGTPSIEEAQYRGWTVGEKFIEELKLKPNRKSP